MSKIVIIDGDIVLFRVCASLSKTFDFGDTIMSSYDLQEMQSRILEDIEGIKRLTWTDDYLFCLSGENNFRKKFFPTYKQNRKDTEKPLGYYELKQWCLDNLSCKMEASLEADDMMGILATDNKNAYIIFSQDKDLKTISNEQWDFKQMCLVTPTEFEADKFLYKQILMGDATDGYCGLEGCGEVKADKILKDCKDLKDLIAATLGAYIEYYGYSWITIDRFLYQAGQARILRYEDYPKMKQGDTYNPLKELFKGVNNG